MIIWFIKRVTSRLKEALGRTFTLFSSFIFLFTAGENFFYSTSGLHISPLLGGWKWGISIRYQMIKIMAIIFRSFTQNTKQILRFMRWNIFLFKSQVLFHSSYKIIKFNNKLWNLCLSSIEVGAGFSKNYEKTYHDIL